MAFTVLLVEDSHGDVALVKEAIKDVALAVQLHVVADGAYALDFLRRDPPYEDAPTPELILLDLKLPRVPGYDVLAALRQLGLHHIPVVILSSSASAADIRQAYALCANAYVAKPLDLEPYCARVRAAVEFFGMHAARAPTS
jgi:CheY-like chemotaxis protein